MASVYSGKKYCRKVQPRVGCTNVTDDRQTDGSATAKTGT